MSQRPQGSANTRPYYIMYNPLTFNLMEMLNGHPVTPLDVVGYLAGRDVGELDASSYREFLAFDLEKRRLGMVETLAIESYTALYVGNQIALRAPDADVVQAEDRRRPIAQIIEERGRAPEAVFMTAMSSNFPTAVASAIALNHGGVPVVIGGIHVSTTPRDVDTFLRAYCPHPELVSVVVGAGDAPTLIRILGDLERGALAPRYQGGVSIEDGVWGRIENVDYMPEIRMDLLRNIPVVGRLIADSMKINPTTPYLGCPYSCNFCSISTVPKDQRRLSTRGADDFVEELRAFQAEGGSLDNRFFFFLPDNLLLGGKALHEILDRIIESELAINFATQISLEVAESPKLLAKLRAAGATHFFIGLESLDRRNLDYIGKNITKNLDKSGLSVEEYYAQKIAVIQDHGISVHGAFIIGLPYDRYDSLGDHTGRRIAEFCRRTHIGLQIGLLTDLPGSQLFLQSQEKGSWLYGPAGSMDYFLSLCIADLTEPNTLPPESLRQSPLVAACMAYEALQLAASPKVAMSNALYMARKAHQRPTAAGKRSLKNRLIDDGYAFASQIIVSLYREHAEAVAASSDTVRGVIERLFDAESDVATKRELAEYVAEFRH